MEKLIIHTNEAAMIIDKSIRSAQRLFVKIRREVGKEDGADITIEEFCNYERLSEERVRQLLERERLRLIHNHP